MKVRGEKSFAEDDSKTVTEGGVKDLSELVGFKRKARVDFGHFVTLDVSYTLPSSIHFSSAKRVNEQVVDETSTVTK